MSNLKDLIKNILKLSPIPFTKNHKYDILTKKILKTVLKSDSNCIDVGCHKGEILDLILHEAPNGQHFGFEPIPDLYHALNNKFKPTPNCHIHEVALSNKKGQATFNFVISNPSYSGLKKRAYDKSNEKDTEITVATELLDNVIPQDMKIDLVKIDVEGGELLVLEGARKTLARHQPFVIFEHGLGASEFYDASPEKIFKYFKEVGLKISNLSSFLKNQAPFNEEEFKDQFYNKINYYFIAHPEQG